jgi:hypothetical protein
MADDSGSNVAGTFGVLIGFGAFLVPGSILLLRLPRAWIGQFLPAFAIGAYLVAVLPPLLGAR